MAKFGYIGRTRVRHRGCKYWYYSFCHSAAVVSILETTTLEEHRKVYRQIQDGAFLHRIRAIGQHNPFCVLIRFEQVVDGKV